MAALASDLRAELESIERSVTDMLEASSAVGDPPSRVALWACGGTLHAFYTGVEKLFELIAATLNGVPPSGPGWHRRLLAQMSADRPGHRPAVISEDSATQLDDFLAFRHRYRNLYLFNMRWEPMKDLVDRAPGLWRRVRAEFEAFAGWLDQVSRPDP